MVGQAVAEVRIEGTGKDRDLVIVPKTGEHVRFPSTADVTVETEGRVIVRTSGSEDSSIRVTFTGDLVLERGEVHWKEGEGEWQSLWRRARTRSRPWWRQADALEIEVDSALHVRIALVGSSGRRPPEA